MIAATVMTLILATASSPAVTLVDLERSPVAGRETVLRFVENGRPSPGIAVRARYRENAIPSIRHEQELGATGPDGTLHWVPEDAGVVVLSWDGGSHNVSVLHSHVPALGVAIAVLAGILLVGGALVSLFRMGDRGSDFEGSPDVPHPET